MLITLRIWFWIFINYNLWSTVGSRLSILKQERHRICLAKVKEESIYEEDTDVVLENTNTLLTTISQRVKPTGMTYFQNLKVIRKNNQEITLYESNEIVRDFLIMEYLEFLSEISDGRVVNIVGVNEIEKNLNIKQPSSSIGPDF